MSNKPEIEHAAINNAPAAPVYVTQPSLPPLADFIPYLEKIWAKKILTNAGPFHQQLEAALCEYLGVKYVSLFCNATIALMTALQALNIKGEVITTPYSFVATAHSLLWNGITPVFVDIDPHTLNMDATKIAAAITPHTTAIMPVHCYGNPCDVAAIKKIATAHQLKIIYDAAHAFGVRDADGSVLNHGDLSVLSFHATKVFNTFEGGAIICHSAEMKQRIDRLKNFGFVDEVTVMDAGLNGKMSEINAAFGLVQLPLLNTAIAQRKKISQHYREQLRGVNGLRALPENTQITANYSYFPVLVEPGYPLSRDALYQHLKDNGIHARRYFYPLISDFPMYKNFPTANPAQLPIAHTAASRVLCLPIYPELAIKEVDRVVGLMAKVKTIAAEKNKHAHAHDSL